MKILARSQLIPHPTGKGGLIVAGDEASRCVSSLLLLLLLP